MTTIRYVNNFLLRFFPHQTRLFNFSASRNNQTEKVLKNPKPIHCYKDLFPWNTNLDLAKYLASTIAYNKGGLIALNKPFGIKIHGHDKPGARSKGKQKFVVPIVPECDLTVEDTLNDLKHILNEPNLTILKSSEKYSSGLVLLSADKKTSDAVTKSFNIAKYDKRPHLTHWFLSLGCPVVRSRQERVGIHFLESKELERKQPVIVTEFSNRSVKLKKLHPVLVDYRTISVNRAIQSSLVEISVSSVKWHFVRVYASHRIVSILGDVLYSNRMNTLLGMPVQLHIQQAQSFDMPPLSDQMAIALNVPKGIEGHCVMPNMLHLRSILLPRFKGGGDIILTADLPPHFEWTAQRLKLLSCE